MSLVRSGWASSPVSTSGTFTAGEWTGAGNLPIPAGYLMVKNDQKYLYLALDLVGDTGASSGVGDYFWLSFDVDGNGSITPNKDVNYGIWPSLPIRLARQYYLGPGRWTAILNDPTSSLVSQGFATSPASATPHRIWEMRLDLKELGVDLGKVSTLPTLRFGLRVASSSPGFTYDYPPAFYQSFSTLHEIVLSLGPETHYPAGTAGVMIGGVGLIPATQITDGRATTAGTYSVAVQNAAFGGSMHLIGNRSTLQGLWNSGATRYRVLHRVGSTGSFTPLLQTWSNYHWTGSTFVLESFGPDTNGRYPMTNPSSDYSIDDLLMEWNSYGSPAGMHEFMLEFSNALGTLVDSPAQILQLQVDNNLPDVRIEEIRYRGATVQPCSIIEVQETADPVEVRIRAFDPEGNLLRYSLDAYYGNNQHFTPALAAASYPGSGIWQGVESQLFSAPVSPKFPPQTCAYQLRLTAAPRVTNGYSYIGWTEASSHVTFVRKGVTTPTITAVHADLPRGLSEGAGQVVAGLTPEQLGR